jgi:DNA repair protein RadD
MLPTLRDYQIRDLEAIRAAFRQHRRVLLQQPCGSGKGTLASYIIHSMQGKSNSSHALFLVNRRTLVHDMAERLYRLGVEHGVIMGNDPRRRPWLRTHVASIDTLRRREPLPPADLIIVDECRFAVSDSWKTVLARYPNAHVLGLDATPQRTDGQGLGHIFETMVVGPSVTDLIKLGYLVPSLVFRGKAPSMSGVQKTGGDYNSKQSSAMCSASAIVGDVVKTWLLRASDRKTVCFAVDQKHAHELAGKFREAGVETAVVLDDTPDEERKKIWRDFDAGGCRLISSVGVISYGWDHPICGCVIDAAPTTSVSRAIQRWGRGARPHGDKKHFLLLDHASNTHAHGLYEDDREWSLTGPAIKPGVTEQRITTCKHCRCCFPAGPDTCPFCGAAIVKQAREIKVVPGELEELKRRQEWLDGLVGRAPTPDEWKSLTPRPATDAEKERYYREMHQIAAARGYKPKWPAVQYQIRFGEWPVRWMGKEGVRA